MNTPLLLEENNLTPFGFENRLVPRFKNEFTLKTKNVQGKKTETNILFGNWRDRL
jgi:hypothetical protein